MSNAIILASAAFLATLKADAIERFRLRFANRINLIVTTYEEDEDGYGGSLCHDRINADWIIDAVMDERHVTASDIDAIMTLRNVKEFVGDCCDSRDYHVVSILTEKEQAKRDLDERRVKLEQFATAFARVHGVSMGTFAFIRRVKKTIKQIEESQREWNGHECRMEEWAAHSYAGSTESYYSDHDFENGRYAERIDQLRGILDWLNEACPLLMASYRESVLRRRKGR